MLKANTQCCSNSFKNSVSKLNFVFVSLHPRSGSHVCSYVWAWLFLQAAWSCTSALWTHCFWILILSVNHSSFTVRTLQRLSMSNSWLLDFVTVIAILHVRMCPNRVIRDAAFTEVKSVDGRSTTRWKCGGVISECIWLEVCRNKNFIQVHLKWTLEGI